MKEKLIKCPLCDYAGLKNDIFLYGNHKGSRKKKILSFIYYFIFFFTPKILMRRVRIPRRILLGIWYGRHINTCHKCNLSFLDKSPKPSNLSIWYNTAGNTTSQKVLDGFSSSFFTQNSERIFSQNPERIFSQRRYLESKIQNFHPRRSLEFGAGNAELSQIFKLEYQTETTTVDISEKTNAYLRSNSMIDFVEESIPKNASYDLIICSHVLHLVANFPEVLRSLDSCISDDGVLLIETPNTNNNYFLLDGHDVPYTWFLNDKVINFISKENGYSINDISYYGPKWDDFLTRGIKHNNLSKSKDSITIRSLLTKQVR